MRVQKIILKFNQVRKLYMIKVSKSWKVRHITRFYGTKIFDKTRKYGQSEKRETEDDWEEKNNKE